MPNKGMDNVLICSLKYNRYSLILKAYIIKRKMCKLKFFFPSERMHMYNIHSLNKKNEIFNSEIKVQTSI